MPKKVTDKLPKGVSMDRDFRTREPRYYFRAAGQKKIRLRETPGTPLFENEVACARLGVPYLPDGPTIQPQPVAPREKPKDSIDYLVEEYKRRTSGRVNDILWGRRARMLEEISGYLFGTTRCGALPYADMKRRHVLEMRDALRTTPGAQNEIIRALSAMYSWAIENDIEGVSTNPAAKIRLLRSGDGFHTWTVDEVKAFEAKHPVGSKALLLLHLGLFTGLRLKDLAVLGRQHIRNGALTFRPGKTEKSSNIVVEIPVLPTLQATIDASKTGNMTFMVTEFDKPFSVNGLGNRMRKWCDEAGLPHCTTHGLRKAGATIAAENGATDEELMAIFGWTTKNQTTTYTKKARRKLIAAGAIHKLIPEQK
jgi:integrase